MQRFGQKLKWIKWIMIWAGSGERYLWILAIKLLLIQHKILASTVGTRDANIIIYKCKMVIRKKDGRGRLRGTVQWKQN